MYASHVGIKNTNGYPIIYKDALYLLLNVFQILLREVAWLTDIVVALELFEVREIESFGCTFTDNSYRG